MTLWASGSALLAGRIWDGLALLVGSAFGFAAGSGIRASLYRRQKKSGSIVGIALLAAGMLFAYLSKANLSILEPPVPGTVWIIIGLALGFLMTRPEDAGIRATSEQSDDDFALGMIAPIAAELTARRISPEKAEKLVRDTAQVAPDAPFLWQSMSPKEREELGLNFMRLAIDPEFNARIEEQLTPLREHDPKLWEESLAKARAEIGDTARRRESEQ